MSHETIQCDTRDLAEHKRAEEAIESLARFPSENPDPVLRIERDGTLLYANEASYALLRGWQLDVGQPAPSVLREVASDALTRQIRMTIDTEHDQRIISFFVAPVVEAGYANLYGRDVTDRKRAEEALHLQGAALEAAANAIVITDRDGNILWTNMAWTQLTGYTAADAIGRNPRDLVKSGKQDRSFYKELWDTILAGQVWHSELINRRKDGSLYTEEMTITPLGGQDGVISNFIAIKQDITERKRAEAALRVSEERFALAVQGSNDGVWDWDIQNRTLYWSPHLKELLGYAEDELDIDFDAFDSLLHPADKERVAAAIEAHLKDRVPYDVEERQRTKSGEYRWFRARGQALWDETGNPVRMVGFTTDITERKQMETALRESEKRYRDIFENATEGIFQSTPDGHYLSVNPAFARMYGFSSPEEMIRAVQDIARQLYANPQERQEIERRLQGPGGVKGFEAQFRRKDGTQLWGSINARAVRDASSNVLYYEGTTQDITERKQAEAQLAYQAYLLENVNDAIIASDAEYKLTAWNAAAESLYGWKASEVLGRFGLDVTQTQYAEADKDEMLRTIAELGQWRGEATQARKDGARIRVEVASIVHRDDAGQITGYISVNRDITERKQMEMALHDKVAALQTLTEIDREIIAATEPQGILNLVCRHATELVHTQKSAIALQASADNMALAASYGLRDPAAARQEFARHWQVEITHPNGLDERKNIVLNDVSAGSPYTPEFCAREDIRAYANAPLVVGATRLGALIVFDTQPRAWTADELQILNMLAGQAAIAFDRVRLYQAAQNRATQLATLNDIGQALTSTLDLDCVLTLLLDKARQSIGAEACSVALMEAPSGDLVYRQAVGQVTQSVVGLRLRSDQGIAGWVAAQRQSALVTDAASDPRFYRRVDDASGFATRDVVCVPLVARDAVVGVIELLNKTNGRFDSDDVRLLESVTAQAAIAIENARLFETESAGRQRLQTLYRIGQTLNSTLNAEVILDRLTDEAMLATHATHGSALVARPDLGYFERRSLRGYSSELVEKALANLLPMDRGVNGRAYHTRQIVYQADVQTDPDYYPLVPGTRSEMAMPIVRGGQVIGNLDLQSPELDAFHQADLSFLQALTDQVAIALENARLFQETRRQLDELAVVSNVALTGAAGRPFDETVARASDALSQLWPEAALGFLFVDETNGSLRLHPSYHGGVSETIARLRVPLDQGIAGQAVRGRRPVRVGDVTADPGYISAWPGIRSEMAAPLVVGDGSAARPTRVIGVVNVESLQPDAFSGDDLRLLATLAGQLATIFEKARLDAALEAERASLAWRVEERTAELRAANEQLHQAHEKVSRALEKERELGELKSRFISIASHEFRTPLTTILSSAELLEHYGHKWTEDKKLEHLRRIQTTTQNMTALLDDVLLVGKAEAGKLEFAPAQMDLARFCRDMVEELQLSVGAKHSLVFAVQGDGAQATMDDKLLRHILSNLLSNAIKYSPPGSEVRFDLTCLAGQATFVIKDRGMGIPLADQARLFEPFHRAGNVRGIPGTGLGLDIVKRSVDLHGGTIDVTSEVNQGTTVVVKLPLGRGE